MGPHDPADGGQRLGLEGGDADTVLEQDRAASWRCVFPRWMMARVYVERIRPLGGIRAFVSGARRPVAGLDVRRLGSDVVAAPQRAVLPFTGFSSEGGVVHGRREHVSSQPSRAVVGAAH